MLSFEMPHADQVDDEAHSLPRIRRARAFEDMPTCAACRTRVGVHQDRRLPGVLFCDECWERSEDALDDDDIGVVD